MTQPPRVSARIRVSLQVPWQGKFECTIGEDWVDFYDENGIRILSQVRRFPKSTSKELHYAWLTLIGKFKVDEEDVRLRPVGTDFIRLSG